MTAPSTLVRIHRSNDNWLAMALEGLRHSGYCIIDGVLSPEFVARTKAAMYAAQKAIHRDVGTECLARAGELGILRNMMKYDDIFYRYLEVPEALAVIDKTISETAILHVQNGFVLPSFAPGEAPKVFQNRFHQDFPRVLNGALMSVNVMYALDAFTADNGGTLVVPGTHQRPAPPDPAYIGAFAVPVICEPGGMFIFDSTLYHAAGANVSGKDRLAINHQFTRSYIKQQIDYVRALGNAAVEAQPPRTQQLLGWYTRVVTSLDEYYRPEAERLYRRGQG